MAETSEKEHAVTRNRPKIADTDKQMQLQKAFKFPLQMSSLIVHLVLA